MKRQLIQASAMLIALALNAAHAEEKPKAHDMMDHSSMEKQATNSQEIANTGTGVIHSIDPDKRVINLTHEPMPEIGWPTMTMDLPTTKRVDLSRLKAGDKVDFKLKLGRDKKYRIIEITPK